MCEIQTHRIHSRVSWRRAQANETGEDVEKRIPIGAWSYCWSLRTHPDPVCHALLEFDDKIEELAKKYGGHFAREMGISRGTVYKAKARMSSGHEATGQETS